MIITFAPLTGTYSGGYSWGTPVTLCSGGYQGPEDWSLDGAPIVDIVSVIGQGYKKIYGRGNRVHRIGFQITRENADFIASQARSIQITAALGDRGLLSFTPDVPTGSPGTTYYTIGSVTFNMTQIGIST